ncbi:hypothetical protein OAK24_01360 [Flavobacteriales bacterium]|nr:hypothetical protein [Flavobacteriales bacterium]
MKKLLLIIIALPLIFSSCEKEENNGNSSSNSSSHIIDTWKMEYYTNIETTGYLVDSSFNEVHHDEMPQSLNTDIYWVFNDGTCFEYVFEDDSILVSSYEADYEENDDVLTLDNNVYTINELTPSSLDITAFLGVIDQWDEDEYWQDATTGQWVDSTITYYTFGFANSQWVTSQLPEVSNLQLQVLSKEKYPAGDYKSFLKRK